MTTHPSPPERTPESEGLDQDRDTRADHTLIRCAKSNRVRVPNAVLIITPIVSSASWPTKPPAISD